MPDHDAKRDMRIRRRILETLEAGKAGNGLRLRMISDIVSDCPDGLDSDEHLIALVKDLENLGLVSTHDLRTHKKQPWTADYIGAAITAKGTGLLAEVEPVCKLVDDPRISRIS